MLTYIIKVSILVLGDFGYLELEYLWISYIEEYRLSKEEAATV